MSKPKSDDDVNLSITSAAYDSYLHFNEWAFNQLRGKLLTLADAAFSDPEQRKGFKDMLRNEIDFFEHQTLNDVVSDVLDGIAEHIGDASVRPSSTRPKRSFKQTIDFKYSRELK